MKKSFLFVLTMSILFVQTSYAVAKAQGEAEWQKVPDARLDTLRAGFVLENGMIVNIRYAEQLFVNGNPVSNTYFDTVDAMNSSNVLFADGTFRTVLQNNVNDQILTSLTYIDISISQLNDVQRGMTQTLLHETLFQQNVIH